MQGTNGGLRIALSTQELLFAFSTSMIIEVAACMVSGRNTKDLTNRISLVPEFRATTTNSVYSDYSAKIRNSRL